jgi:hypothetical protein
VRNFRLPDFYGNFRQACADFADPIVSAQRGKRLSDGLVKRSRRDIEGMGNIIEIVDRDRAGPQRH